MHVHQSWQNEAVAQVDDAIRALALGAGEAVDHAGDASVADDDRLLRERRLARYGQERAGVDEGRIGS